jgi:hypothetical protein
MKFTEILSLVIYFTGLFIIIGMCVLTSVAFEKYQWEELDNMFKNVAKFSIILFWLIFLLNIGYLCIY